MCSIIFLVSGVTVINSDSHFIRLMTLRFILEKSILNLLTVKNAAISDDLYVSSRWSSASSFHSIENSDDKEALLNSSVLLLSLITHPSDSDLSNRGNSHIMRLIVWFDG